ncbi:MAG: type II secretion system F family protein [bacterium]|nr:type II secretion system F family protein [bacterium]MDN5835293.1 type II secretion system F family protein [bacterium]
MSNFKYTAINPSGNTVTGTTESTDRTSVIDALNKQGLRPISVKEAKAGGGSIDLNNLFGPAKVKSDDIVIFTRQLSAMVGAGVPLLRSLTSMADNTESAALKNVLTGVTKDIESGSPLGEALAKYPNTFSDVYVNMVAAGEAAGILDEILGRLAMQQEKSASMRKKIKSAMTYPMVLIAITVIAFFGLMLFVMPSIGGIVKNLGGEGAELPPLTQAMLAISDFMRNYWFIVFPVMAAGVVALLRYIKTPVGKKQFHRVILKLPAINTIIKKVAVARFARTFSALMGAGVSVLESLDITGKAIGNSVYEEALHKASENVENGDQLSKIIAEHNDLFPAIISQMLSVGEETGQTDKVLVKVADFYEEEVDIAIDGLSSIIEPIMIVMMGGMVGLIAASVMLPIAGMANQIKA